MHYVVTLDYREKPSAELGAQQRAALAELTEQGILMLVGPFTDGAGGMAILQASSLDEANARYGDTPLARSGQITWQVREWDPRSGGWSAQLSNT
jgi:uncharacterized protein YciI